MADDTLELLKLPPHSIEAEQSVLGGLLLENEAWDKVADLIGAEDFYRHDHRLIYEHICALIERSKPADLVTVAEFLEAHGRLDEVGGLAYLGALVQNIPSAANIVRYAEIVRERAILRRLVEVGSSISESAFNPQGRDANALLDEAEAKIFEIKEHGARAAQGFIDIKSVLPQVVERLDKLSNLDDPSGVTGIPTGFTDLDRMTSGMQSGELIIVAGRPSMGKTAFALNIAEYVALHAHKAVAIFSLEMPSTQLAMRLIGSVGRIDQHKMRTGQLEEDDWDRLTYALGKLNEAPIFIDESSGINAIELRARARRLKRRVVAEEGIQLGLVVVDYLQLMTSVRASENRATEVAEISRSLKALAKELDVPVVALSQVNRKIEDRTDKRPVMSDLRESGAIEQDADVILFLYRDEVYNKDSPYKGTAEVIIGKQRNGPTGSIRLTFLGENTRFENYASGGYLPDKD
ncbi:MAG: replicative DNA helicase [Methylophilaceae bacterium]|nr:replicative DNA helicase [Methylophilaceae bacterium]